MPIWPRQNAACKPHLSLSPSLSLGQIGTDLLAQLACLAATLCYALAGVWARRFRPMGIPPVAVATGQLTASALVMLPLVLIFEPPWQAVAPSPQAWMALVALALSLHQPRLHPLFPPARLCRRDQHSLLVTFLIPITAILLGALHPPRAARAAPLCGHGADWGRPGPPSTERLFSRHRPRAATGRPAGPASRTCRSSATPRPLLL